MTTYFEFFSPFSHLIESKQYPFSRFLRTSLIQKISDVGTVFAGDTRKNTRHVGLIDWCTLFITPIMIKMTDILSEIDSIPTNLAFFPLALLTIGLISVINLVSLVLTLLLIPIIVAAHLISSVISRLDHQQVLALDGIETLTNKLLTLEGYLEQTNCTIEDLYATYSPENHEITVESLSSESKFKFQVFSNKSASAKSIHSFFKLNIGQISNECEIEESKLLAV